MSAAPSENRFIREEGVAARVAELIEAPLEDLGFRLVRVHLLAGKEPTLQIMAERPDGTMRIEDCEQVSRQISPLLDAYDPLPETYRLEVSSPGIDRPLVRAADFENWSGYAVKIELNSMVEGRRRFRGVLEGVENGEVRLEVDLDKQGRQTIGLPFDLIHEARLVLTDDLVRESLRRGKVAGADLPDVSDIADDIEIETPQLKN